MRKRSILGGEYGVNQPADPRPFARRDNTLP